MREEVDIPGEVRAYKILRRLQLAGGVMLFAYGSWLLSGGRHLGAGELTLLLFLAITGLAAEIVRKRAGVAFTWSGAVKSEDPSP